VVQQYSDTSNVQAWYTLRNEQRKSSEDDATTFRVDALITRLEGNFFKRTYLLLLHILLLLLHHVLGQVVCYGFTPFLQILIRIILKLIAPLYFVSILIIFVSVGLFLEYRNMQYI
jgi:hypothetical protein